jgi:hypothetical protein
VLPQLGWLQPSGKSPAFAKPGCGKPWLQLVARLPGLHACDFWSLSRVRVFPRCYGHRYGCGVGFCHTVTDRDPYPRFASILRVFHVTVVLVAPHGFLLSRPQCRPPLLSQDRRRRPSTVSPQTHPHVQRPSRTPKRTPRSSPEPQHPHLKMTRTTTCRPLPHTHPNLRPRALSVHL